MKELKKHIRELLYQKLSAYGFKKKQQWILIRTIGDGNIIQIIAPGFSHGARHELGINILVGVIYKNINEVAIKLDMGDRMEYYGPTMCLPICNLMPEKNYYEWHFSVEEDDLFIEKTVNNMAETIIKYGFPYLEELSTDEGLLKALIPDFDDGRTIPILYYLQNDKKRALEHIEEHIKKLSRGFTKENYESAKRLAGEGGTFIMVENNALKYYMDFVEKFKQLLNEESKE